MFPPDLLHRKLSLLMLLMLQVFLKYANFSRLFLSAILYDLSAKSIFKILQICDCTISMNSRIYNLLNILTLVSMESSHLVIFSTTGKFITKLTV